MNKRVAASGGLYLASSIFNRAIGFLTVPLFTRLLTTGEYGLVNTYTAWVRILFYFVGLCLEYTIRNAYVDYPGKTRAYMSSIFSLSFLSFLVVSAAVLVFNAQTRLIGAGLICVCCVVESYGTFVVQCRINQCMMEERYIRRTLLLALPNLVSVILAILLIRALPAEKYIGKIIATSSVMALLGLGYIANAWIKDPPGRRFLPYWRYALPIALPLILHALSNIILAQSDRIMLTALRSESETGVYSMVYNMSMVIVGFTGALEGIWTPWFTRKITAGERDEINATAAVYLRIVAIAVAAAMLVAPEFLKLMAPMSYWSGIALIPPIASASYVLYLYSLSVGVEFYHKSSRRIARITCVSAILNLVLNSIFIPRYGAVAAAYTTLASYMVSFALHYAHGRKLDNALFPLHLYLFPAAAVCGGCMLFYLSMDMWLLRWGVAAGLALGASVYYCNQKKGREDQ